MVKHGRMMTQINTTPVYENTVITIKSKKAGQFIYENDQIIAWINAPIMKIVRAIRVIFPNAKLNVI